MDQELEKKLIEIVDKNAIRDVLMQYCMGADQCDGPMVHDAFHSDAHCKHDPSFDGPASEFVDMMLGFLSDTAVFRHNITTVSINLTGENEAQATSYCIVAGENMENKNTIDLGGYRYEDLLEKRDGKWAIVKRLLEQDWEVPGLEGKVHQSI